MDAFSFRSEHFSHTSQPECLDEPLNLSIRIACQDDLEHLTELICSSFHYREGLTGFLFPVLQMGIYEDLRYRLKSPSSLNGVFLVAVVSPVNMSKPHANVVGAVEISFRSTFPLELRPSNYPYLSNLAVSSKYRRRGIAQKLLSVCETIVQERGFQNLYLHVLEDNYKARQLYVKAGYGLKQIEFCWYARLFRYPRRLLLHKQLAAGM